MEIYIRRQDAFYDGQYWLDSAELHLAMMRLIVTIFLAFAPSVAFAACNADNVLRARQANAPKASPFCSTYTLPPPNQPLPTTSRSTRHQESHLDVPASSHQVQRP